MKGKLFGATKTDYILSAMLIILAIIILFPFYNAILISIVSETEYVRSEFLLFPKKLNFSSYSYLFEDGRILNGMKVTAFVTIVGCAYNMFLTVFCAYALSKPFFGRKVFTYLIIFTVYFSGGLIPYYMLMKNIGLMDSLWAMILPTAIEFTYMIVIRRHIEEIPQSLLEAAEVDGAGYVKTLFIIVFPLVKPIIVTFALYYAVDRWNEWWNGMLFIKTAAKQPLQLILRSIVEDASTDSASAAISGRAIFGDGIKMAATVLSMLPVMIIYPFLQRFFISGMTMGAVKE
ncbi:MAG: carbohydrate ABC transporter permease [Lachnospirales bacterium]